MSALRRFRARPRQRALKVTVETAEPEYRKYVALGARLRLLRLDAGMTQEQLGSFVGASKTEIGYYEAGKRRLTAARLNELARTLRVDVQALFDVMDVADGKRKRTARAESITHLDKNTRDIIIRLARLAATNRDPKVASALRRLLSRLPDDIEAESLGRSRASLSR